MISYKVTMLNSVGKQVTEVIPAENEQDLLNKIKQRGNYCVSFETALSGSTVIGKKKLKLSQLVVFCYQMSAMMSAGVPLLLALKMIQGKAKSKYEAAIYSNLYEEVQKGNSLSSAMELQDGAFEDLLISMIRSGESTGSLDEVLVTMADQYERDKKIKNKIKTASMYPIVLLVVSVVIVLLLVTFILPKMIASFPTTNLPLTTRILMGLSNLLIDYWYVFALIVVIASFGIMNLMRYEPTRIKIHRMYMYMPVIGKLNRTIYSARTARSFASLYKHGVPALEMIKLTGEVIGNAYLENEFERVYVEVSRGDSLSKGIGSIEEFDSMLPAMIRVGEEVGDLENILIKTANYFDGESETAMTQMISLIEPVMIVVLGIIVATIVVSIMLPMFMMYDTVR